MKFIFLPLIVENVVTICVYCIKIRRFWYFILLKNLRKGRLLMPKILERWFYFEYVFKIKSVLTLPFSSFMALVMSM
jgi:hypothetical protein